MTVTPTWFRTKLTHLGTCLFTDGFYPEPEADGCIWVWFTQIDITPNVSKVVLASRLQLNSIRLVTLQLALSALEPTAEYASRADSLALNLLLEDVRL